VTDFLIEATKATDMAFFCTAAWEGGFWIGFPTGMGICMSIALAVRIIRGRA